MLKLAIWMFLDRIPFDEDVENHSSCFRTRLPKSLPPDLSFHGFRHKKRVSFSHTLSQKGCWELWITLFPCLGSYKVHENLY